MFLSRLAGSRRIIGRNRAGKSALLKILSRITEPVMDAFRLKDEWQVCWRVGTGFHHRLTGRERLPGGAIFGDEQG